MTPIATSTLSRVISATLIISTLIAGPASAGNYGYFNTYNSKVSRGEMEVMLMNDVTQPSATRREEGQGTYFSHMLELEYGITSRLSTELMVEWFEDVETREVRFTGFRWENRFRIFEQEVPLNPMLYIEYEDLDPRTRYKMEVSGWVRPPYVENGAEPDRERILETRLVLSQDVGAVNLAFNWINETELTSGYTAFGYSLGAMWMIGSGPHGALPAGSYGCPMHPEVEQPGAGACPKCGMPLKAKRGTDDDDDDEGGRVGLGFELFGTVGDIKAFALDFKRQEHYLGPIFMYHLTDKWMLHAQLALGLTAASDHMARLNVAYEF